MNKPMKQRWGRRLKAQAAHDKHVLPRVGTASLPSPCPLTGTPPSFRVVTKQFTAPVYSTGRPFIPWACNLVLTRFSGYVANWPRVDDKAPASAHRTPRLG